MTATSSTSDAIGQPPGVVVPVDRLRACVLRALAGSGIGADAAAAQADMLIEGNLRGRPSHGVQRLPTLIQRIRAGLAQATQKPDLNWRTESLLVVDGRRGLGPVVGTVALKAAIERCQESGVVIVAMRNVNHLGMLAPYVESAARQGRIGIGFTTSEALVHAWGGREPLIGTNPIAVGIPGAPEPVVLDMATSQISAGQIIDHRARDLPLPVGAAVDRHGVPTTDPEQAIEGALSPFGGAKGYGLGLAIELLVAALTSTATGKKVLGTLDSDHPSSKGDVFVVVDPAVADPDWNPDRFAAYLGQIRSSGSTSEDVLIPGDGARARRARAMADGITLPTDLWAAIRELAAGEDTRR
ncbi:Ldh family oxidoreductase [Phytohabitans kaempferiae]|uniref:Ldh family oxidoreductase n=1 Tax=Phytohabitans kaempferiae TaxID=1620943 RepID=A0ABV6M3C0_9ACTN